MAKVRIDFECLKELIKDEPLVKLVEELPNKETASLSYIYLVTKGDNKKAYVLKPDRSEYESIDLSPQLINVLGEGYITVDKETLNDNGDVTFTVKADETLKTLLKTLEDKVRELEGKTDNDSQTLTLDGNTLTISNGNSVKLPSSTSSEISTYSLDDNKYAVDSFIKGGSFTGSDENFSFPMAQLGKLEALVGADNFFLRTQYAEGGTISREIKDNPPVDVKFVEYEETDVEAEITKFLDNDDEKFKEGRIEVLDSNLYPTLLRYKNGEGKVFRISDGIIYATEVMTEVEGDAFKIDTITEGYFRLTGRGIIKGEESSIDIPSFYMNFKNNSCSKTKIIYNETMSPVELIYTPLFYGKKILIEVLCKTYVDGNVYLTKLKSSEGSTGLRAKITVKENGNIVEKTIIAEIPYYAKEV